MLLGCASQKPIQAFNLEGLREIDRTTLCRDYYALRTQGLLLPQAQEEIERVIIEKGVPRSEVELARQGKIQIGMSQDAMYAAWGTPSDENRTVGEWGVHIQHVYGSYSSVKQSYVYTENGVVKSWQN